MHKLHPTGPNAVVDRLGRHTQRDHLSAAKHTVLPARQLEDRPLQTTRGTLTAYIAVNVPRMT
jgi:hypothetical protein